MLGGWLAGTALLWSVAARRLRRLTRLLNELPPAPDEIQSQVRELASRLGLRRPPLALLLPPGCGLPPLVFGLAGRARLALPADLWRALDGPQRRTLLLHELAHLRRGDHWVRWLELLALGLYWWHPVAWWASARLRHAEELCCDAWVVWAEPEHAADYAAALVEAVAMLSCPRPRLPGVSAVSPVVDLERRIVMIFAAKTHRRLSLVGAGVLVAFGAALLPLAPTLAAPDEPKKVVRGEDADPAPRHLIAMKSCQACHEPKQKPKKTKTDDLHAEVVRLMDEVAAQRAKLNKAEAELKSSEAALKRALDRFEAEHGAKPAHGPKPKLPKAEKGKDRFDELEEKLEALLLEVQALRKEKAARKQDPPRQ
jgi:hypothetical protein